MGEQSPVKPGSHGVVISVSVLVSDSRPKTPILLPFWQLELEARAGIEPAHRAFAELGLTTWLPRLTEETEPD